MSDPIEKTSGGIYNAAKKAIGNPVGAAVATTLAFAAAESFGGPSPGETVKWTADKIHAAGEFGKSATCNLASPKPDTFIGNGCEGEFIDLGFIPGVK